MPVLMPAAEVVSSAMVLLDSSSDDPVVPAFNKIDRGDGVFCLELLPGTAGNRSSTSP